MKDRTVLLVEDDSSIRRLLKIGLKNEGFAWLDAPTLAAARLHLQSHSPDLLLLDLGLPDGDGQAFLLEIRQAHAFPILVLSSRHDERGKIQALDNGADDYLTKPFSTEELCARIRVALRHRLQQQGHTSVYQHEGLKIDVVKRTAHKHEAALHFTPREWLLLETLVKHAGKIITHKQLLQVGWNSEAEADIAYLRIYIRQLRQKLGEPDPIQTESGIGYRWRV